MTEREVSVGMLLVAVVYGVLGAVFGFAALRWEEGITVIPATLCSLLSFVGSIAMAWVGVLRLLEG